MKAEHLPLADLVAVTKPIAPYDWKKHGLTVVRDGYLPDGVRVHVVKERLDTEPMMLDGAVIINEASC